MGGGLLCLSCGAHHKSLDHFCFQSGVYKISTTEFIQKFQKLCEMSFDENRFQNCKMLFETENEQIEYVTNFYNELFEKLNIE